MSYWSWYLEHGKETNDIIDKLIMDGYSTEDVVNYFVYENMVVSEPDFCPLYKQGRKCHNIIDLNCLLCGCPYFIFDDDGIYCDSNTPVYSMCSKSLGDKLETPAGIHHDCTRCTLPHSSRFALKLAKENGLDWFKMMEGVKI